MASYGGRMTLMALCRRTTRSRIVSSSPIYFAGWDLAVYPVEDHGFVRPSSWTDEYSRIFDLFERTIGPKGNKLKK